jgi:hypothetical protein
MLIYLRKLGKRIVPTGIICASLCADFLVNAEPNRAIPKPLPSHPGNIFLAGENVIISPPPGEVQTWRMNDYDDKMIAHGDIKDGGIDLGKLPVGYYKIVRGAPAQYTNRTWIGVIEPLRAPTPMTSPIGIDVAMAWCFPDKTNMEKVASICQLAGINHVRDRLLWGEIEPKRGEFVPQTRYDTSAQVQSAAGLRILQVCHVSAPWANPNAKRFPDDLRDIYNFYRDVAQRWKNEVGAFEPWNEADIEMFGGHTGSEMASLQKAAFLGLKVGNPNVIACENVFAIRRPETLQDFAANNATAYFDTYNLHNYEKLENYPGVFAAHRANSGGKPIWVTETSVHAKWSGDEHYKELSEAALRTQSEQVTKTFVMSLHEGVQAIFYFMLPHYSEYRIQYGLLHPDLSPRAGYVALSAVGRLLADAKPLGRLKTETGAQGYLFDAKPDGKKSKVLVIWSEKETTFELPNLPEQSFDHLGRVKTIDGKKLTLTNAPIYAVFDEKTRFDLIAPPKPAKLVHDKPGELVLQALPPEQIVDFKKSAYKIASGRTNEIPIFLYNFGTQTLRGKLKANVPKNWNAELISQTEIAPGERKALTLNLISPENASWTNATVKISGRFSSTEKPVLSMQLIPE